MPTMTGVEFHEHLIDVGYEIPTILELPTPTKKIVPCLRT